MTPEQLEGIEARAKAATPGPWSRQSGCVPQVVIGPHSRQLLRCYKDQVKGTDPVANAAHIAGMDPSTTLALTAALRKAWENEAQYKSVMAANTNVIDRLMAENELLRESIKTLERPTMYWPDGECSDQPPEEFLENEYQMRGQEEWEEEFGNEGVMEFMCAHYLPHVWVAYRRHPDGFVTSEHKTEEEARAALKEPTHDQD